MQEKEIKAILDKYQKGECSPEEKLQVELWYFQQASNSEWELKESEQEATRLRILSKLNHRIDQPKNKIVKLWPRIAAAASILLFLSGGAYFIFHKPVNQQTAQNQVHDIAPGSNKAILKLANGKTIVVTDAKNGLLAQQGNTSISKQSAGMLVYAGAISSAMQYDTLIVPRGGQHQLTLADGTIAYLNADTKLRYPESFSGKERDVELISGEVILQVKHNPAMPFKLMAKGREIHDIGTEFDVSAYNDEPGVKTTLISGVVRVMSPSDKAGKTLRPGQQAVSNDNAGLIVRDADIDEITAWRDGMFRFSDTPLGEIMKQVSRWYNVDVVYQDDALKDKAFGAITTRFGNVSELLHVLEMTRKVKFKIEGRKILVMNP